MDGATALRAVRLALLDVAQLTPDAATSDVLWNIADAIQHMTPGPYDGAMTCSCRNHMELEGR